MKTVLLHPDKVAISFFASIEKQVSRLYNKAHAQETPATPQQQKELFRKVLLEFLKVKTEGSNKENHSHAINHPERREATLTFIRTQEKLLEKEERAERMNKQMELEFELTRNFLSQFMKDMQLPILKNEFRGLPEPILSFKRRDTELLPRNPSHFQRCLTERESLPVEPTEQHLSNLYKQNKTLAKLSKLEKFVLRIHKTTKNCRPESIATSWNFSPTKEQYKLENETLKILQEHLRNRLIDGPSSSDNTILKEQSLRLRERRLADQQQQLFRKEMMMNRRHMQIIRKEKQLKGVA